MLAINPKTLPRLDEIEDDLLARRARAEHEAWLGEVEGIDLTFLQQKREETRRPAASRRRARRTRHRGAAMT
jgi:hypothetical protein